MTGACGRLRAVGGQAADPRRAGRSCTPGVPRRARAGAQASMREGRALTIARRCQRRLALGRWPTAVPVRPRRAVRRRGWRSGGSWPRVLRRAGGHHSRAPAPSTIDARGAAEPRRMRVGWRSGLAAAPDAGAAATAAGDLAPLVPASRPITVPMPMIPARAGHHSTCLYGVLASARTPAAPSGPRPRRADRGDRSPPGPSRRSPRAHCPSLATSRPVGLPAWVPVVLYRPDEREFYRPAWAAPSGLSNSSWAEQAQQ
jgi:hypothetical protein